MESFTFLCVFYEEPKRITGVSFCKQYSKYLAQIYHEAKHHFCGYFSTELEAAQAVNAKCVELDISLKNPEVGLPDKRQVRFKESNASN